jgi:hypothetical protein
MQYVGFSHEVIYMQYVGLYCARMHDYSQDYSFNNTRLFTCSMLDWIALA